MHDHDSVHPLLAQVPLSVSPFIHLPSSITLPYTYQTLPASLPQSSTDSDSTSTSTSTARGYITSPSGAFSTTPAALISSCQTLVTHLTNTKKDSEERLKEWEKSIEERDLMEKRRVAPGYLDTGVKLLVPIKKGAVTEDSKGKAEEEEEEEEGQNVTSKEGEELDKLFGGIKM